ncbi:hypothetical protein A4A58_05835 [Tardiphaga robiniae]|uniref:Phage tail collar domain-containing protein n=2 Tax=Tardiphaga robiniae TaxID=943830 RepID=A0A163Z5D0_9BRAD|nr:hypothetical protein A4A58_05835 [Tardiphaga robiniae]
MNNADDHMRLIKAVLKNTLPGLTGPITRTGGLIVPSGASGAPAYSFADEETLGFYRSAAGLILIGGGRLDGNGAVPVGSLHTFLYEPSKLGKGGVIPSGGAEYLELDGSTYNTADFARLATHMGIAGSTFTLTNVTDTGRFIRSRRTGVAAGTKEASLNGAHTHAASGTTDAAGYHAHNVSGSTGFMDRANPHSHGSNGNAGSTTTGGGQFPAGANGGETIFASDINHAHSVSGGTDGQGSHAHNLIISVAPNVGAETRPEALSAIICIKT